MYQAFFKWQGVSVWKYPNLNLMHFKTHQLQLHLAKNTHSCCCNVRYQKGIWITWYLQSQTWPYTEPTCWQGLANYVENSSKRKKPKHAFHTFQGSRKRPCFIPEIWTIIFNLSLSSRLADSSFSICCSKAKLTFSTQRKLRQQY